jgi:hypothetical protein
MVATISLSPLTKWASACGTHSQVQTQPKLFDFLGEKILSTPSFGGEVKLLATCKKSLQLPWKSQL